jgi:hypothetical protein
LGAFVHGTQCGKGTRAAVGARVLGYCMCGNMLVLCVCGEGKQLAKPQQLPTAAPCFLRGAVYC